MLPNTPTDSSLTERLEHYFGRSPSLQNAAFVANCAKIMGDVTLGKDSSVFYGAVLRGDIRAIHIGKGTNIQDGTIVHMADDYDAIIGDYCTIGHAAIIHACKVGNECLVGMRAVILDGAEIGDHCLIAAGALVTQHAKIPPGSMVMGSPAKVTRALSELEIIGLRAWAEKYIVVAKAHAARQNATA